MLGDVELIDPPPGVAVRRAPTASGERFRLVADVECDGLATGRFDRPTAGIRWRVEHAAADVQFCGFAFTQFALPVVGDRSLDFDWAPSDGVRSPNAVLPLLARAGDRVTLLAPVTNAHEQVLTVGDGTITWGWHGDLDAVPAGFAAELGVYTGASVTETLAAWIEDLRPLAQRTGDNALLTHLSYWTDNGAAYWYRTEPGEPIADCVVDTVRALRADGVPVRSVELDSWWYDHETPRPIAEIGYPEEVPPSGAMRWAPRVDAFAHDEPDVPVGPVADVSDRLGGAPLVLHARHISPRSPYVSEGQRAGDAWWASGWAAHPVDPAFFRRWFDDAVAGGATVIEQDWMLAIWFGVPELRARPGRALAWQRAMNDHAARTGVDLMWCMATPADLIEAAHLDHVIAVRTSDDYRFADDPAQLWTWFLTVNRLAGALGLRAFKDVFFSNADMSSADDAIDGDPHAELEAALAALSGGPVGIGDRRGRTDRDLVMRTCDDDGRLRGVDTPIALIDDCLFGGPARGDGLAWATTTATTADGVWTYVLAINTADATTAIRDSFVLPDRSAVLDWRSGSWSVADEVTAELAPRDWLLALVAPSSSSIDEATRLATDVDRYVVVETGDG